MSCFDFESHKVWDERQGSGDPSLFLANPSLFLANAGRRSFRATGTDRGTSAKAASP